MMDYRQGMIDGLELALTACDKTEHLFEAKSQVLYYLKLAKDDKFEKIKEELGIFR